jgi:hypothetical protein
MLTFDRANFKMPPAPGIIFATSGLVIGWIEALWVYF